MSMQTTVSSRSTPPAGLKALMERLSGKIRRFARTLAGRRTALADDLQQEMWLSILEAGPGHTDSFYLSRAWRAGRRHVLQAKLPLGDDMPPTAESAQAEWALRHCDLDADNLDWTSAKVTRMGGVDDIPDYRSYDPTDGRSISFGAVRHHWTTLGAVRTPEDEVSRLAITRRPTYRILIPRIPHRGRGGQLDLAATLKAMSADERALTRMLLSGAKALEVGQRLGVSERTVRRRIKALEERLRYL
jgi:DNA-binding CsgD family transcriptional regulator